jgi:hypothetical protein
VVVAVVMRHLGRGRPCGRAEGLGAAAGQGEEHVVHAGVAHGQRGWREVVVVQQPQHVDEQPRAVVGGQPDGRAVPLRVGVQALGQQFDGAVGAGVVAHPELDHGAAELGLERSRGVVGDHPPAVHDRDAVRQPVGLLQVLGGQQHRGPLGDQFADHPPQRVAAVDVQPGGRLVEEDHLRALYQGGGDVQAAAHPAGVGARGPVGGLGQLEALQQLVGARAGVGGRQLRQAAGQPQVLPAGQVGVDGGVLAGEADVVADLVGLADHVQAEDLGAAAVGP